MRDEGYGSALKQVLRHLDEKGLVEFTRRVARIPSVHGDEKAIATAFAERMDALGLETERSEVEPGRFNVLGWLQGAEGGRSLTLNGHLDTVVHLLGWKRDPYGGELVNGRLYGHGISNMKASDTAMAYAAAAFKRAGVRLAGDLLVSLVVGECHGGVGIRDLMKKGVKTDVFVNGEPTYLNVLTVHAYSQYFRVNIVGRTGHFGTHDHGVNAIMKMYELVRRLGPVHTKIPPRRWLRYQDKTLYHGLPRYHIGTIRGGLTREFHEGPSNTPDFCTAVLNVRATPNKPIDSTRRDIERVLSRMRREDNGFHYEVSVMRDMRGFEAPLRSVATQAVAAAYEDVLGKKPQVGAIQPYMFMASDSGHMQAAGMKDGVLVGPGRFTSSIPDEHVEVSKLIAAARIYAAAALRICGHVE
jgi:acetylornithine deacetylase